VSEPQSLDDHTKMEPGEKWNGGLKTTTYAKEPSVDKRLVKEKRQEKGARKAGKEVGE